jgi:hypothetical protein
MSLDEEDEDENDNLIECVRMERSGKIVRRKQRKEGKEKK